MKRTIQLRRMLVSVGAMLSPIPSAHGQEFREPIAQNGIPISTLETAFAEIRKILEPQFEELLLTPATHIVAKRETLRCMEQWDEEDAPIAMYLREFAIDIPLARVKAGGSPLHWAGGPRFRLSNGWWVIFNRSAHFAARSINELKLDDFIPAGVSKESRGFFDQIATELKKRLTFGSEYELFETLYKRPFENIDIDKLPGNELVETWTLLQLKLRLMRTGDDKGVALIRTTRYPGIAHGTFESGHYFMELYGRSATLTLTLWHPKEIQPGPEPIEPWVRKIAASVRRHDSQTPGRDMRDAASRVRLRPGQEARLIAGYLLLSGLMYEDGLPETRMMLRSLLGPDMPFHELFGEMLARSARGRCMTCGEKLGPNTAIACKRHSE